MASSKGKDNKKVQGLANKLAGVASVAKSMGINTAKSDAMVAQTKAQGSKAYKGSSYDRGQQDTITSKAIAPILLINIPKKDPVTDLTSTTDGINSSLATGSGGMYTYDAKTGFVNTPTEVTQPDTATNTFNQYMKALAGNEANRFNAEAETKAIQKALRPKENLVNSYQNQINQIVATRDAQQLGLEGQGRGITETIIGGQQAQIGREAAIKALPLQAQLAAAQSDLDSARSYASQMYAAKAQDAQAKYQYEANKLNAVYGFLTEQEAKVARAKEIEQSRAWQVEDRNISMAASFADKAFEYGQSTLAGKIMGLDTKSPTFAKDYAALQGQVRNPVEVSAPEAPKVVSVNGVDSIWNPSTGQFEAITVGGVDGTNLKPVKDLEIRDLNDTWIAKNSIVSIVDEMTKSIKDKGTKIFWGTEAGKRGANKTNLLLAMKNLEKTGALDKGTIDVLADLIPENEFWATEDRQIGALNQLKDTITSKTDEFVGSYRGTTAETDPRTQRIYSSSTPSLDMSMFQKGDVNEVYSLYGITSSSTTFNADEWLK